jgi:hypothetical protein
MPSFDLTKMLTEVAFEVGDFHRIHDHIVVTFSHIGKREEFKFATRFHPRHGLRMIGKSGEHLLSPAKATPSTLLRAGFFNTSWWSS